MTLTRDRILTIVFVTAMLVLGALLVQAVASAIHLAHGDAAGELDAGAATGRGRPTDASPTSTATEPVAPSSSDASHLEASTGPVAPTRSDASTPAASTAPPPLNPIAHPGDALAGFRLWWRTGWVYAVAFGLCGVLIAIGERVRYLRTGWRALVLGTVIAAITGALVAKGAGMDDAHAMAAALNVLLIGGTWGLRKNRSTIDLSTATPDQVAAALAVSAADREAEQPTPPRTGPPPIVATALLLALLLTVGCRPPPPAVPGEQPHRTWVEDLVDGIRAARQVVCELPRQDPTHPPNRLGEAVGDAQVVLCAPPAAVAGTP